MMETKLRLAMLNDIQAVKTENCKKLKGGKTYLQAVDKIRQKKNHVSPGSKAGINHDR